MRHIKKKKLESKGWKVGTKKDFLSLSKGESSIIQMKLALVPHKSPKKTLFAFMKNKDSKH